MREERHFPKCTGSGCFFLRVLSIEMWCVVALRGNREPGFRYLLAIANPCVIVGLGKGCGYETAT